MRRPLAPDLSFAAIAALPLWTMTIPTGAPRTVERPLAAPIAIPAGTFVMGLEDRQRSAVLSLCKIEVTAPRAKQCGSDPQWMQIEGPPHKVYLSRYAIDRVEVTVAAYTECVRHGACAPDPLAQPDRRFLQPELPVTHVTWHEAAAYCAFTDGRLPTEAEWERAARGTSTAMFPWGDEPRWDRSNHGRFGEGALIVSADESDGFALLAPGGRYPAGASNEGVLDLSGNASEWTADAPVEQPSNAPAVNPRTKSASALRIVRGGSWRSPLFMARTTWREAAAPDTRSPEIGFRCVH